MCFGSSNLVIVDLTIVDKVVELAHGPKGQGILV